MNESEQRNVDAQARMGEIVLSGNFDAIDEVVAPDVVDHDAGADQPDGAAGIAAFWMDFQRSFTDLRFATQQLIATGEFVTVVADVSGTHAGRFAGHAPTGRSFTVRSIQVGRFTDGRMVERWGSTDELAILNQLGLTSD